LKLKASLENIRNLFQQKKIFSNTKVWR